MHVEQRCSKVRALSLIEADFMFASDPTKILQGESPAAEKQIPELGNSDRIRLKFGNYGIEIVENGLRIRVSNLFSTTDGLQTNRTFAVVMYPAVIEAAFQKEHEAIINGQSIGIVFKDNGWTIDKRHQYIGQLETLTDFSDVHALFGDIGEVQPVIHVYSLIVKKDNAEFHYASIAEVHHPEYLDLEELKAICGSEVDSALVKDQDIVDFLKIVESKMRNA
ncbi:MAG: hypothetical protein OEU84_10735 [Xanthomonadales bacterium]|nr:hypothetical protein [Xanthomonadales bacterium]MDH4020065.1 hypothetical protein [Xanthomonadales bacterium]